MKFTMVFEGGEGSYIDRKIREKIKIIMDSIEKEIRIKKSEDFIDDIVEIVDNNDRKQLPHLLSKYFFNGGSGDVSKLKMMRIREAVLGNLNSVSKDLILFVDKVKKEYDKTQLKNRDKFKKFNK